MECEKCGYRIDDVTEECESRDVTYGKGFNNEFAQTEYWFSGEFECPNCSFWFDHGDSSL